jgi:hypothetical protein
MTLWDLVFMIGLKQGDMENIVDLELGWKFQLANLSQPHFGQV